MRNVNVIAMIVVAAASAVPAFGQITGPNAVQSPHVIPSAPGVITKSIISNGGPSGTFNPGTGAVGLTNINYNLLPGGTGGQNAALNGNQPANTYRLGGIPDGLGAFDNNDGTFTILANHEVGAGSGIARNGAINAGAYVSQWVINKSDLSVVGGKDLITSYRNNPLSLTTSTTAFSRFCSSDLPEQSAFQFGSLGTSERIYMTGEETGSEGRGIATVVSTGVAYNTPHLGKFSWENSVANPFAQTKTIVAGTDDSGDGQVYIYVGDKKNTTATPNPVEAAGLTGGKLFGLRINALDNNSSGTNREQASVAAASFSGTSFSLVEMGTNGDVSTITGATLETQSDARQVTQFARVEDAHWNPNNPNELFFVTTSSSRLFRATFTDITNPESGGRIDVLYDTSAAPEADDNITVVNGSDGKTRVLIQEDGGTGTDDIWMYTVEDNSFLRVATHDSRYSFANGAESTGIIDAQSVLGQGWFLYATQSHYGISGELVEGGQVQAIFIPQASVPEPSSLGVLAAASALMLRRRK